MRILVLLTWYMPHLSGLTVNASRLAAGMVSLGHEVTVLASQHQPDLPREEVAEGVRVVRSKVLAHASKGVIMPSYLPQALRLADDQDTFLMFLPAGPIECIAAVLAARKRPMVVEYTCDIRLPGGWVSRMVERASALFFHAVARAATLIVHHTDDYARTSPFLARYMDKVRIRSLPIWISHPRPAEVAEFRARAGGPGPIIGIAARLAADKGFEILLDALPLIRRRFPDARVLHAGNYESVVGEEAYRAAILPRIQRLGDHWHMLGVVHPDLASFYAACDVLVLPSVNRTESFGMVQVEAMLCGTPVAGADLPGVRYAVQTTGMGKLFRSGDVQSLAGAVISVFEDRGAYVRPREELERLFSQQRAAEQRLEVFREALAVYRR